MVSSKVGRGEDGGEVSACGGCVFVGGWLGWVCGVACLLVRGCLFGCGGCGDVGMVCSGVLCRVCGFVCVDWAP